MMLFRNIKFVYPLILIIGFRLIAFHGSIDGDFKSDFARSSEPTNVINFQNSDILFCNIVEGKSYSQIITEVHRLSSVLMLSNRVIPFNYNFKTIRFIPLPVNVNNLIPIFIKGHALLN